MKTDNILKLADFLENDVANDADKGYYQRIYHNTNECNTVCCIAGWAAYLGGYIKDPVSGESNEYNTDNVRKSALKFLGLRKGGRSDELFHPDPFPHRSDKIEAEIEDAVWTLRNLAKTGEVVWQK